LTAVSNKHSSNFSTSRLTSPADGSSSRRIVRSSVRFEAPIHQQLEAAASVSHQRRHCSHTPPLWDCTVSTDTDRNHPTYPDQDLPASYFRALALEKLSHGRHILRDLHSVQNKMRSLHSKVLQYHRYIHPDHFIGPQDNLFKGITDWLHTRRERIDKVSDNWRALHFFIDLKANNEGDIRLEKYKAMVQCSLCSVCCTYLSQSSRWIKYESSPRA
jgi:hypothetical protein